MTRSEKVSNNQTNITSNFLHSVYSCDNAWLSDNWNRVRRRSTVLLLYSSYQGDIVRIIVRRSCECTRNVKDCTPLKVAESEYLHLSTSVSFIDFATHYLFNKIHICVSMFWTIFYVTRWLRESFGSVIIQIKVKILTSAKHTFVTCMKSFRWTREYIMIF